MKGPDLPEVYEIDDMTDVNVRAAFIVRFGPQCAGWLCNRFRRELRRAGSFSVHLPAGAELPPWFDIAVSYLEKHRPGRWSVARKTARGVRFFRVFYVPFRNVLPLSIVPVGLS